MERLKTTDRGERFADRAKTLEYIHAIASEGMRGLMAPLSVSGKYGYLSLNEGFVTGWKIVNDQLVFRVEVPVTPQKVEVGETTDLYVTFPIATDVTPTFQIKAQLISENKDDLDPSQERYLNFLLQLDRELQSSIEAALNKMSYTSKTMATSFGAVRPKMQPWQKITFAVMSAVVISLGIAIFQNRNVPKEDLCNQMAVNDPATSNRKMGYIRYHLGTDDPQAIVDRCRKDFGIVVPLQDVETILKAIQDRQRSE